MLINNIGGLFRNISQVTFGAFTSQVIWLIATPLLTYIYSPAEVGKWILVMTILMFIQILATQKLELAIVLPESEEESNKIIQLIIILASFISLITLIVLFLLFSIDWLTRYELFYLPVLTLSMAFIIFGKFLCVRKLQYKKFTAILLLQAVFTVLPQLLLGWLFIPSVDLLLIGNLIGNFLAAFYIVIIWLRLNPNYQVNLSIDKYKDIIQTHWRFPIFSVPYSLLGMFGARFIVFFIGANFGDSLMGIFMLAYRLSFAPVSILVNATRNVYYGEAVKGLGTNLFKIKTIKLQSIVSVISIPAIIIVIYFGDFFVESLLKEEWHSISEPLVWLFIASISILYTGWLDKIYDVRNQQKISLALEFFYNLCIISFFISAYLLKLSFIQIVAGYSIVTCFYNIFWLIFTLFRFKLGGSWLLLGLIITLCYLLICYLLAYIITQYLSINWFSLSLSLLVLFIASTVCFLIHNKLIRNFRI